MTKRLFLTALLCGLCHGQVSGGAVFNGQVSFRLTNGAPQVPALPMFWVDNNEGLCVVSATCYPGSPALTVPYVTPAYALTLTPGGGAWSPSQPACVLHAGAYADSAQGLQYAWNDQDYCDTNFGVGFIVKVPTPATSETATGCPAGWYCFSKAVNNYGGVIPNSRSSLSVIPKITESVYDSTLAAMPQPVCAGGVEDNVASATQPGLNNPDCTGRNMYYQAGPQNDQGVISGIVTVSVSTTGWGSVISTGTQFLPLRNGYVSATLAPTTTASNNGCASGYLSVDSGINQECVRSIAPTPGTASNQGGLYGNFTKTHTYPFPVTYTPDSGAGSGTFALANGIATSISAYNYLQYMPQIGINFAGGLPLQLCTASAITGGSVNVNCATNQGPSNWTFADLAVALCPGPVSGCAGASNNQNLVATGNGVTAQAVSSCVTAPFAAYCYTQYAHDIHFRRIWAHGDWTSLYAGTNAVADGFNLSGCYYCSVIDYQVSQALRPGEEGHCVLNQGNTTKISNGWCEGMSSGVLQGGVIIAPAWLAYNSGSDLQLTRYRGTFPYSWLGWQCSNNPSSTPTNNNNGCYNIPGTNAYWGGAGDNYAALTCGQPGVTCVNIASGGTAVTYVSGPPFHDANSFWSVGHQKVLVNGSDVNIGSLGPGTCSWPLGTGCPTTMTLQTAATGCSSGCTNATFVFNGNSLVRKNAAELKQGQRILIAGAILENVDNSGGQNGIGFANAVRSISGVPTGAAYNTIMSDITVQGIIMRNLCDGFTDSGGRSANSTSGDGVSYAQARFSYVDALGYNISLTNPGCGGSSYAMTQASAGQFWNVTAQENTAGTAVALTAIASVDAGQNVVQATPSGANTVYLTTGSTAALNAILCGSPSGAYVFVFGFVNAGNNSPAAGFQCVSSTNTSPLTITLANSGGVAEGPIATPAINNANPILNNTSGICSGAVVSVTCPAVGFQVLDMLPSDPAALLGVSSYAPTISGAACATFAMPNQTVGGNIIPAGVGPLLSSGTTPWTGTWNTGNVTITYPWVATPLASDPSGYCVLSNTQGSPAHVTHNHETLITTALETIGNGPAPTPHGPPFITGFNLSNSIIGNKGNAYTLADGSTTTPLNTGSPTALYNSSTNLPHEGQSTESFNYDVTTMSLFDDVWPGRAAQFTQSSAGCYVEYGNNPLHPDPGGCTGAGCAPTGGCTGSGGTLPTMSFPAALHCSGATATSACVGFAAAMSAASTPLTMADYHGWTLVGTSSFHNAASDGTDVGARIANIDSALTNNLYVCGTPCGAPGPFPDH